MQWRFVLALVCLCVLFFELVQDAEGSKKRMRSRSERRARNGTGQKGKGERSCHGIFHNVSATEISKGLTIKCRKSYVIADVNITGHNGKCMGLTPDVFVQSLRCHWQKECRINYNESSVNYMIKHLQGDRACVVRSPQYFVYSYACTNKIDKSGILSLSDETPPTKNDDKKGIVRSHASHPWMYRGGQPKYTSSLLLASRDSNSAFFYTFRSLHLSQDDTVNVSSGAHIKIFTHDNTSSVGDDAIQLRSGVIKNAKSVTVSLDVQYSSRGGDGFVMCFAWMKYKNKPIDVCNKVIKTQKCKKGR